MSSIASLAASSAAAQTKAEKDKETLVGTTEDFLTILLAQLKHQDPLDPMKGTEFIDSITRLSSVEQDINQNFNLEKISDLLKQNNNSFGSPVSYLNKDIEFFSNRFKVEDGQSSLKYDLEEVPSQIFITITDDKGQVVRSIKNGSRESGENSVNWDNKDNAGNLLGDGNYFISVDYTNKSGKTVNVPVKTKGTVTGANFEGGEVVLMLDGNRTTLDNVISVNTKNDVGSSI